MDGSSPPTTTTSSATNDNKKDNSKKPLCPTRPYAYPTTTTRLPAQTSIIGLGCSSFSQFYDKHTDKQQQQVLLTRDNITKTNPAVQTWIDTIQYAILKRGVTLLDTAPWYGHGTSEIVVGYALEDILYFDNDQGGGGGDDGEEKNKICRGDVTINTKIGRYEATPPSSQFDFSYHKTIYSTQLSIQRLKCAYIDVLQLHDPEFAPSISLLLEETIPAMLYCRDTLQIVKALGITGYPLEVQHEILVKTRGSSGGDKNVVFDQSLTYCHANLHDDTLFHRMFPSPSSSSTATTTNQDKKEEKEVTSFANYCTNQNIALLTAAPFSMGLLTSASSPPLWHPACHELKVACKEAAEICKNQKVDLTTLALLFALSRQRRKEVGGGGGGGGGNGVSCLIVGMKNQSEVDFAVDCALRLESSSSSSSSSNNNNNNNNNNSNAGENDDNDDDDDEVYLKSILTPNELQAYEKLRDDSNGPFASVWSNGTYQWDGMNIVKDFWNKVEGGMDGADIQMRKR